MVDPYPLAANRNLLAVAALDRLAKDDLSAIDIANLDETPFIGRTGVLDLTAFAAAAVSASNIATIDNPTRLTVIFESSLDDPTIYDRTERM